MAQFIQKKSAENTSAASIKDPGAGGKASLQLKRAAGAMDYEAGAASLAPVQMEQDGAAKSSPVAPEPADIVRDAFVLGGESRYQVSAAEAMQWIEQRMDRVPPEHKFAWQEARKIVNKRL